MFIWYIFIFISSHIYNYTNTHSKAFVNKIQKHEVNAYCACLLIQLARGEENTNRRNLGTENTRS